ncbi:ACT domain-containing protein [Nocardia veterana]|uniref:ACT domain-containing protein n=1 Tax=Nocardia veterana TaxID=132249 RepID=A0A7X6RL68_9NOCA|nr:ACT domain-containing protein [Nocardia veterana]NKY89438.1 ACT domain-containing protein [Nocardia veterana]
MPKSPRLHIVPSRFSVDHLPTATFPEDDEWVALVRAPEGLTVIREAPPWERERCWVGLYAATPRDLDEAGALVAILNPLADSGIPVFVASTFHADLVLIPEIRQEAGVEALTAAGFEVVASD